MTKILTFIDASVLIYAAKKPAAETLARRFRALQLLSDPEREFVTSEFVKMEACPYRFISNEIAKSDSTRHSSPMYQNWADSSSLVKPAYDIACGFGVSALDALHIEAANHFKAEFVSAEKPTKPIYRAYDNISSIY